MGGRTGGGGGGILDGGIGSVASLMKDGMC